MGLAEFSNVLWRERQLLDLLVFKLEEEQLVLGSGRSRWLNHATREVDLVLDQIKAAELARAVEVAQLGSDLGLGANPSLRQLADSLDAPWHTIFDHHRRAFLSFTHEIQALALVNRELLSRGQRATQEALSWLAPDAAPEVHSSRDISTAGSASPRLVNDAFS